MSMTADQYRHVKSECCKHLEDTNILIRTPLETPIFIFTHGVKEILNIDYGKLMMCKKGLKHGSRVADSYQILMCENRRIYNEVINYELKYPHKIVQTDFVNY